jgi:hypothetical protein
MLLRVSLTRFLGMVDGVMPVTASRVRVMGSLFVISALVMFGCFGMMLGGVGVVLRCLLVVLGCFLRHDAFPSFSAYRYGKPRFDPCFSDAFSPLTL